MLGVFIYDSRPNRAADRRLVGRATPGEVLPISPSLRARPLVVCRDGLAVRREDIRPTAVTFTGAGPGT